MRVREMLWHPATWDLSRSQWAFAALGTVPLIWWSKNYWTARKPRHAGPTDFNNFLKVPAAADSACELTYCQALFMAAQPRNICCTPAFFDELFCSDTVKSLMLDQRMKELLNDACDAVL